jgi:membrane-associated phospholipid phosphatase
MSPFDSAAVVVGSIAHHETLTRRGRARSSSASSSITETVTAETLDAHHITRLPCHAPDCHSSITDAQLPSIAWILERDTRLSTWLYDAAQGSLFLRILAKVISLSCDEVLWFLIPCVVPSVTWASRGGPLAYVASTLTCEEEMLLDVFGAITLCVFVEQIAKSVFQRARPNGRTKGDKLWCVFGEWWSFPSGHTLRAFYLYVYFAQSSLLRAAMGEPKYGVLVDARVWTLVWACAVGWARVAMGKHHLLDVVVGAAFGLWLGEYIESGTRIDPLNRIGLKTVAGVVVAVQAWFYMFDPLVRMAVKGTGTDRRSVVPAISKLLYFGFYLCALWSVSLQPLLQGFHATPLSLELSNNNVLVCARSLQLFG